MRILPLLAQEADWAGSILDAVGSVAERAPERWDGDIAVADADAAISTADTADAMHAFKSPLIMPRRVFTTVKDAFDRRDGVASARQPSATTLQSHWDAVVAATGSMAATAYQKIGPIPDIQGQVMPEDLALDAGLAGVWTEEQLAAIARHPEAVQLMSPDGVPDPHFRYQGGPETSATRDLLSEVLRQQGKEVSSENYVSLCNELKLVPPDRRWTAVAAMMPGAEEFDEVLHLVADVKLQSKFLPAVEASKRQHGTPNAPAADAVRELAVMLREGAVRQAVSGLSDPAQPMPDSGAPAQGAATKGWWRPTGGSRAHGKGE
ncbi:hypothetical protein [Kribbella sp. NPDC055071]